MRFTDAPRLYVLTRRDFLELASAAAVGLWIPRARADGALARVGATGASCDVEGAPVLRLPAATRNGAKVPIVVEMTHPMTPDHHVTTVRVMDDADPVPSKGAFHFTPANGRVHLAFQARIHDGVSDVVATAECNRGGRWSSSRTIEIPEGAGG